ncbi:MAG: DJ-1/PfpI family protein [Acidobacteria bacterium]|nr:DJ-1/PfpI family protein [Acidobacteriota bacterium]
MTAVGLVLYPRFTALDIVGPFQTLVDVPGLDVFFVAAEKGPVVDHTGRLTLEATRSFDEVDALDVLVVPGGMADREIDSSDPVVRFIERIHPTTTWTTSVCTGSIYLAHAGILDGLTATTHWASHDRLRALGAVPTEQRVITQGKIITAAGVSSGIDMGLVLVAALQGEEMAKVIQLAIEYDPKPPFDAGAPSKVTPEFRDLVAGVFDSPNR